MGMVRELSLEEAVALRAALNEVDLASILHFYGLMSRTPMDVVRGYLVGILRMAKEEGRALGEWQEDLSVWLRAAMQRRIRGEGLVRPNTYLGRRTVLMKIYQSLERHGLMQNPIKDIQRVPAERNNSRLPSPADFERLSIHMDTEGRAQFFLLYHHALRPGELFELYWEDVEWEEATLLRATAAIELTPESLEALREYSKGRGGELFSSGKMFDLDHARLRQQFWRAFKVAGVEYVSPQRLRLAGLRDFHSRLTPLEAGFMSNTAYATNMKLLQTLSPEDK